MLVGSRRLEVVLADALGFCFGVRDAIAHVRERAKRAGSVTVLGPIVHNPRVVESLARENVRFVKSLDEVPRGTDLVLTPHGVADSVHEAARDVSGENLSDATCPLVRKVHVAAKRLVEEGRHVVVVGRADHVEVRGLVDSFPRGTCTVVLDESELEKLEGKDKLGIVVQTTQPESRVRALVAAIRERADDVEFVDTICHPTKARQEAVARLAPLVDAVVVVGGKSSNNTRELAQTALALGKRAWWIETASEIDPAWFVDVRRVGIAAGTSTPDDVIAEVVNRLESLVLPPPQPRQALNDAPQALNDGSGTAYLIA